MEERFESTLRHLLLQNSRRIRFRLAAVDDEWQAGFARRRDMKTEALFLGGSRAEVVVVVEPRLADPHHLGMTGQRHKLVHRHIQLFMSVMRVGAYGTENIIIFFCYSK